MLVVGVTPSPFIPLIIMGRGSFMKERLRLS